MSGLDWTSRSDKPNGKKYVFVERNYEKTAGDQATVQRTSKKRKRGSKPPEWRSTPSKLDPKVQDFIRFIFNNNHFAETMSALHYDPDKLPLRQLSQRMINHGYQVLKDMSALLEGPTPAGGYDEFVSQYINNREKRIKSRHQALEALSNHYYSLIPHDFGRRPPPTIQYAPMIKKEIELLQDLSQMKDADLIAKMERISDDDPHPLDQKFAALNLEEMEPLSADSAEFRLIQTYLINTSSPVHNRNYDVVDIFRIKRKGESERFEGFREQLLARHEISDRRLLWHGSRSTNFASILSQGLRIAPAEAIQTGTMFGKGVYLADMASKSANYCFVDNSNRQGLLLLCEAELGHIQPFVKAHYVTAERLRETGALSVWGQGRFGPRDWTNAKDIHESLEGVLRPHTEYRLPGDTEIHLARLNFNEYICYDEAQIRLRYLIRFRE